MLRFAVAGVLAAPLTALACSGAVTIGEGADQIVTPVDNRAIGARCINELIVDTVAEGAAYDSHGEFVARVAHQAAQWAKARSISAREAAELVKAAARSEVGKALTVRLIGLNDFHGNLQSPGTFGVNTAIGQANRPAVGGAEYIAGHVAKLKSANPNSVVVGAGDFIGASPLISALFNDEPAVQVMNRVGLDFNSVGNHEFDKGAAELLRLQNGGCKADGTGCHGGFVGTPHPFEGASFQWLSANVLSTATGRPLLPAYGIRRFGKVKVAFIGMTLEATPTIVTPSGVAGLEFRDEADTVNALVPELRAQGVATIIVLVHEGGFQTGAVFNNNTPRRQIGGFSDINGCDGNLAGSPIAGIVARLNDAVDAVVSGHTHAAYNCSTGTVDVVAQVDANGNPIVVGGDTQTIVTARPTGLPNASGRLIPVTSASSFGRVLTTLDLVIDTKTRDVKAVHAKNHLVAQNDPAVTPNAEVAAIVAGYNALVSPIANRVIGSISAAVPNTADAACNNPAGDLIADAQLAATSPVGFGEAVVAFMNRGGVRAGGFTFPSSSAGEGDGNITYGEAFTVQPFGNSLVTMTLTRQDIKNLLEQQFAGCRGQTANRVMLQSAGFTYEFTAAGACDARVRNVRLNGELLVDASGTVIDELRPHRVTVNNFMATGGDGFATLLNGTNLLGGAQDIDALVAYLEDYKAPNAPYNPNDPALGKPRKTRLDPGTACP